MQLLSTKLQSIIHSIFIYIYTRETSAFGGISLALRGNGAFGAHLRIRIGVPKAAYAAFSGDKKKMGHHRRPKWFYILDPCHEGYEYVLGFEIEQRESGFYSERTESPTESQRHPLPY